MNHRNWFAENYIFRIDLSKVNTTKTVAVVKPNLILGSK